MLVLVYENRDKRPNVTPVQYFAEVLTTQIVLSLIPNIYQKFN